MIGLIVLISCASVVFLYPLTYRATFTHGSHQPLTTVKPPEDEDDPAKAQLADAKAGIFEYVEAAHIVVKSCKDLRLRAEAMARIGGRINSYVVLGLGKRRMRTAVALDSASPHFSESFWVLIDKDYDANQLLSMQVYHHSLHPSESDVRIGIGFFSLVGTKAGDTREWKAHMGTALHEAGEVHINVSIQRVPKQRVLAMETRAFKLQDFSAWPAQPGFVQLATSMVKDQKWLDIFKQLQPQLFKAVMSRQDSPHRVMLLLQASPVLSAYGMVESGGTRVSPLSNAEAAEMLHDGCLMEPRLVQVNLNLYADHTERIDLTKVTAGSRAQTMFQAAFQRPLMVDKETNDLINQYGNLALDIWLQTFANAINLAVNNSRYESLRTHKKREEEKLRRMAEEAALMAKKLKQQEAEASALETGQAMMSIFSDELQSIAPFAQASTGFVRGMRRMGSVTGASALIREVEHAVDDVKHAVEDVEHAVEGAAGAIVAESKHLLGSDDDRKPSFGRGGSAENVKSPGKRGFLRRGSTFGRSSKTAKELSKRGSQVSKADVRSPSVSVEPTEEEERKETESRRLNFTQQLAQAKLERKRRKLEAKDEHTWSSLRRTPFRDGFLRHLQQSSEDQAMELVTTLLSKAAFESLSELSKSSAALTAHEERVYAFKNDDDAKEKYEEELKRQHKRRVREQTSYEHEVEEVDKSKIDSRRIIGGGWLDITIDSYSIQPADDAQAHRDELGAFIRTLASLQVGISSICPMDEQSLTVDNGDLYQFRFFNDLHSFEEAVKLKELHPGLHRDRAAIINIGALVTEVTVEDKKKKEKEAKKEEKEIKKNTAKDAKLERKAQSFGRKDGKKGAEQDPAKNLINAKAIAQVAGQDETPSQARARRASVGGLQRGNAFVAKREKVEKQKEKIEMRLELDAAKIDKMRILAESVHIQLGLFVHDFPPPPAHVELAESLVAKGFSNQKSYIYGSSLCAFGSTTRLPKPPNAPADTPQTGRALPTLGGAGISSIERKTLHYVQRKNRQLTIDMVRQHIHAGDQHRESIETCLVWMHRLLSGTCSPRDQRLAVQLLSSQYRLIEQTIATFGFKYLFYKLHGYESVQLMRVLRDCGYLSLLSPPDRARMLLFFLQIRVTIATQEGIACLFESSSPAQSEAMMRHVGVRLLRFSVGGLYWRRCLSGLSNPYVSPLAVHGMEPALMLSDASAMSRARDIEALLRGPRGAKAHDLSPELRHTLAGYAPPPKLQYNRLAALHSGDLLLIYKNDAGDDTMADDGLAAIFAQAGEVRMSTLRKHQPQIAVVIGLEHLRPKHNLVLMLSCDEYALGQGVRRAAVRSFLGLNRVHNMRCATVRRLFGAEEMLQEHGKAYNDRAKAFREEEEVLAAQAKSEALSEASSRSASGRPGFRSGKMLWARYKVQPTDSEKEKMIAKVEEPEEKKEENILDKGLGFVKKGVGKLFGGGDDAAQEPHGTATIVVVRGERLLAMDKGGKSDPYVYLTSSLGKARSKTVKGSLSPKWEETLELAIAELAGDLPEAIRLRVYDQDTFDADDLMGEATIELAAIPQGEKRRLKLVLSGHTEKGPAQGSVEVDVRWAPPPESSPDQARRRAQRDLERFAKEKEATQKKEREVAAKKLKEEDKEQDAAATRVQAMFRGKQSRKDQADKRAGFPAQGLPPSAPPSPAASEAGAQEDAAAAALQAATRGLLQRTKSRKLVWQGHPMMLSIKVPDGVNAGDKFGHELPDGEAAFFTCPKPYPTGGAFKWRWNGPGSPTPIDVIPPQGIVAGDMFTITLDDGRSIAVICPTPMPEERVFMFTPPPSKKLLREQAEQMARSRKRRSSVSGRRRSSAGSALSIAGPAVTASITLKKTPLGFGLTLDGDNIVTAIKPGSQASRGGFSPGDMAVAINGRPILGKAYEVLATLGMGDEVVWGMSSVAAQEAAAAEAAAEEAALAAAEREAAAAAEEKAAEEEAARAIAEAEFAEAEAEAAAVEAAKAKAAEAGPSGEPPSSGKAGPSEGDGGIPPALICPITQSLMSDPVCTIDGLTYEREAITEWLGKNDTSPLTGKALASKMLIPNVVVRGMILELLEKQPELAQLEGAVIEEPEPALGLPSGLPSSKASGKAPMGAPAAKAASSDELTPLEAAALADAVADRLKAPMSAAELGARGDWGGIEQTAEVAALRAQGFDAAALGPYVQLGASGAPLLEMLFAGIPPPSVPDLLPKPAPAPAVLPADEAPPAEAARPPAPAPEPAAAGPSAAGPSSAGLSAAGPSSAGSSGAGPSTAAAAAAAAAPPPAAAAAPSAAGPSTAPATAAAKPAAKPAAPAAAAAKPAAAAAKPAKPAKPAGGLSATHALLELLGETVRLPELVSEALRDPHAAADAVKQQSAELPAALYEKLGLLPAGSRHTLKTGDFLEGGLVDRRLFGCVWLGPQQEAVLRPRGTVRPPPRPTDAEVVKQLKSECKARLRAELGRSVPGVTVLRGMADAAFSLAEEIRVAGLSTRKRREAERRHAPQVGSSTPLDEVLEHMKTGDLVLLQSDAFSARFVQHALRCEYSHCAVVVRLPKLPGIVFLLEADPDAHHCESSSDTRWHLQLVDARSRLASWLEASSHYVSLRALTRPADAPVGLTDELLDLLCPPQEAWDKALGGSGGGGGGGGATAASATNHMQALIEALYGLPFARDFGWLNSMEGIASMRAAEAVCLAYKALGALDQGFDTSSLTLTDFSLDPPLALGYSLGAPVAITRPAALVIQGEQEGSLVSPGPRPVEARV